MNIYSIYKITNQITGKVYIGYTNNPSLRWTLHIYYSKKLKSVLYSSMLKHGIENFIFEVIYQSKDQNYTLKTMETFFINEYRSYYLFEDSNGYNMTLGGEGLEGYSQSEIHRKKRKEYMDKVKDDPNSIYHSEKFRNQQSKSMIRLRAEHPSYQKSKKTYIVTSPKGESQTITGINEFCRKNGLAPSNMIDVSAGRRKSCKGWICKKI